MNFEFCSELLPNLNQLHVHIALPIASRSLYDATRSHISATSATFFPIRASPSPALVVFFGVIIEPLSAKVESDKELIRIRATLKDVEDVDVEDEGMPQIPHAKLAAEFLTKLESLQCHGCYAELLSPRQDSDPLSNVDPVQAFEKLDLNPSSLRKRRFRRVRDLPSESWHELLDCWACHKEDYSHLRKGHIGSVIPARPMEALVGLSRIVLHPSDIDKKALKVVFSRQKDAVHAVTEKSHADDARAANGGMATMLKLNTWKPLACTACGFLVGEALNVESADEEPASLKFFRHAVNLAVQGSEVLYQRPFPLCFVDEIIETAQSHATRRFIVETPGSKLKPLLLWLMTFDAVISSNVEAASAVLKDRWPHPARDHKVMRKAVKIMFMEDDASQTSKYDTLLAQWAEDKSVDRLQLDENLRMELTSVLERTSKWMFSASSGSLDGFRQGFIPFL